MPRKKKTTTRKKTTIETPGHTKKEKPVDIMKAALDAQDAELAGIVREIGLEADKRLLALLKAGVPESTEDSSPQTSAYVSALALAMKRTGKLIEKQQIEHSGEVRAAVLLPIRTLLKKKA
jgi:hypothetical protein